MFSFLIKGFKFRLVNAGVSISDLLFLINLANILSTNKCLQMSVLTYDNDKFHLSPPPPPSHVISIRNYMSHPFNPTHYTCDLRATFSKNHAKFQFSGSS